MPTGDVTLHLAEAGDGPPMLLLHGWPQHWWCWRRVIGRLARDHRVIAPDLRGFGWSDAPPGDYAKATLARDILALLDAEGIDRTAIVGHDWGGYVAFLLALEHPERVQRILALDIAPPWSDGLRARQLAVPLLAGYQVALATPVLGRRLLTSGPGAVRTIIRAGSARQASWSKAELDNYADVLREPARAAASSACYRTFLTREAPAVVLAGDRSCELRVPALLAMGGRSAIRLALDPRPSRNVRVQTVAGAGHFLPEEAPEEVLALATGWFAR
ncbi:MAG TPA: alpha/beta fold hydrolase [Solirubrobacteraceae bacterium]|nr:alpha/beta fold hydrolase [Solirubrobacteraceae bacterium]